MPHAAVTFSQTLSNQELTLKYRKAVKCILTGNQRIEDLEMQVAVLQRRMVFLMNLVCAPAGSVESDSDTKVRKSWIIQEPPQVPDTKAANESLVDATCQVQSSAHGVAGDDDDMNYGEVTLAYPATMAETEEAKPTDVAETKETQPTDMKNNEVVEDQDQVRPPEVVEVAESPVLSVRSTVTPPRGQKRSAFDALNIPASWGPETPNKPPRLLDGFLKDRPLAPQEAEAASCSAKGAPRAPESASVSDGSAQVQVQDPYQTLEPDSLDSQQLSLTPHEDFKHMTQLHDDNTTMLAGLSLSNEEKQDSEGLDGADFDSQLPNW